MPGGGGSRDIPANVDEIVDLPLKAFEALDNFMISLYA